MDVNGGPLPWLTYPSIELLAARAKPAMTVFEYGCGWSTLWWASRVASVVACEHDQRWYLRIAALAPPNVTLIHEPREPDGAYTSVAARFPGRFDIVVIDGRDRARCATQSVGALKPTGVFVWDNTDRDHYAPGLRALADQGFRRIDLVGLVPGSTVKSQTSILYRPGNSLDL
jgi:hypothetical protein